MKKMHVLSKPTPVDDLAFDDLYDDLYGNLLNKSHKLQIRRLRMLKRAVKGNRYATYQN